MLKHLFIGPSRPVAAVILSGVGVMGVITAVSVAGIIVVIRRRRWVDTKLFSRDSKDLYSYVIIIYCKNVDDRFLDYPTVSCKLQCQKILNVLDNCPILLI